MTAETYKKAKDIHNQIKYYKERLDELEQKQLSVITTSAFYANELKYWFIGVKHDELNALTIKYISDMKKIIIKILNDLTNDFLFFGYRYVYCNKYPHDLL